MTQALCRTFQSVHALAASLAVLLAASTCLAEPPAADVAAGPTEQWYIVQMQGKRAGWMHQKTAREGDHWKSSSKLKIEIKRGTAGMTIAMETEFLETDAGDPVSMSSTMRLGALPQTTRYRFLPDGIEISQGSADDPARTSVPLPEGEWMTPREAERYSNERIAAGDTEFTIRSIDASNGPKPITTTQTLVERTTIEVAGKDIPALKWTSKIDLYPGMTPVSFTDERGRPVRMEMDIGGIKLTIVQADRDLALAKLDAPELLMSTLVHPDKPIAGARDVRRGVYLIESTGESLPDIPSLGAQKFERLGEKSGRLTVDLSHIAPAPESEVKDPSILGCTPMITCNDERVKELAQLATKDRRTLEGKPPPPAERAESLRRTVHEYIHKKSLDVGFATAAEVAQTRSGDCSEHGVLLCALLRADGIPARVVSGLVYVNGFIGQENIFGFHMWTQALLDDGSGPRWMDLDAALSQEHAFDATHIALTTSTFADGEVINSMVQLAPLVGTIGIKVEQTE